MRQIVLLFTSCLFFVFTFSQAPGIKWQRTIGGSSDERGYAVFLTTDSGYLFINQTTSNNGDVIGNHGNSDIWIIKTNSGGIIEWKKSFGGANNEVFLQAYYNSDGSTTIFTNSTSTDGDITGNHGSSDIWVFKIDASGTLIWQISLGGSAAESFRYADTLSDNGYLVTGYTSSNDGDVSGNHGGDDVWIVKLSSSGNLQWQKCLGGTGTDRPRYIKTMSDGNYVMVGSTTSTDNDVTGNHGSNDLWVVKLDVSGNILWQKAYGGTNSETGYKFIENSGSLIVLADAASTNGDVGGHHGTSYSDIWILNVSYSDGALSWQKCIGGTMAEVPVDIMRDNDGNFLIAGTTVSGDGDASGNHWMYHYQDILLAKINFGGNLIWSKCFGGTFNENVFAMQNDSVSNQYALLGYTMSNDGDVTGFHPVSNYPSDSTADAWIIKLDTSGTIQWERCVGGDQTEHLYGFKKIGSDEYILIGETSSNNNGDIQHNNGGVDSWIIRLGAVNTIKGTLFVDQNANNIKDANESYYSDAIIKVQKAVDIKSMIPFNGMFSSEADTGSYSTSAQLNLAYYTVIPSSHISSFTSYFNIDSFSFALQPISFGIRDLVINMLPLSVSVPGFDVVYKVYYKNVGTDTSINGQVLLKKDSRLNFVSSVPAIDLSNGDTLIWNYSNLKPFDTDSVTISFHIISPPTVNVGDTLISTAWITSNTADQTPTDDTSIVKQIVRSSLDPNDKYENNEGKITTSFITSGKYLNYLIRFQNVGTDTAFNITLKDTLDGKLDLTTIQMIAANNPYTMDISGQIITWTFYNIKLPYSSINEPASNGYIAFRIKPQSVVVGDTIHNTVSIYFDFNLPVKTNDAFTVVRDDFTVLPLTFLSFTGVYHNDHGILYWETANEINLKKFQIERSLNGTDFIVIGETAAAEGSSKYQFDDNLYGLVGNNFYYRLNEIDSDGKMKYSNIILIQRDIYNTQPVISPNPANDQAIIKINSNVKRNISIDVNDGSGKIVLSQSNLIYQGVNYIMLKDLNKLKQGLYFVSIYIQDEANKLSLPLIITR